MDYSMYWERICEVYFLTKNYLLRGEELSDDFDTFLQPLKEHRDAFDHVARAYGIKFKYGVNTDEDNGSSYCESNMRKALGHVYRAFFDTADWLSYICRKQIREHLIGKSYQEIVREYPDYANIKLFLVQVPKQIASIRAKKDVYEGIENVATEVTEYQKLLDRLLEIHEQIMTVF